jgi:hypothetical protein
MVKKVSAYFVLSNDIQDIPGFKVTISRFTSRADSESKPSIHMGSIGNDSGVMRFKK